MNNNDNTRIFASYNGERIGEFKTVEEAQKAVKEHPKFFKSKYTKKGRPRSNYSDLKSFYISDNNGNLYYIY